MQARRYFLEPLMKKIFFAIPCGDFYTIQNKIIDDICTNHNVNKIVIEEKSKTDYLWEDIITEIESSDLFVSDISSRSPNIVIELGYALRGKSKDNIGIFVSKNIDVFSDIKGIKFQEYRSYSEFAELLEKWINEKLYVSNSDFKRTTLNIPKFHEEFKDLSKFIRLWDTPPSCQYNLEFDGLHYTDSHMPIMSNHLALLRNYSFEFKAKILSNAVGWIIKGTRRYNDITPQFCLMFNIGVSRDLMPHIFNRTNIHPMSHFHPLNSLAKKIEKSIDNSSFYNIKTTVNGDLVEIYFEGTQVFSHTFGTHPDEKDLYNFSPKHGQVGFRCHPGEEAVIRDVNIEIK